MQFTKEMLNEILVKIFNQILFNEERYLSKNLEDKITLRSVHILEAISELEADNLSSMGNIAEKLNITAGTLTTLLKKLENDDFIVRKQSTTDKRKYFINLTNKGKKVVKIHDKYHAKMIDTVTNNLSIKEESDLVDLLSKIKYYFTD